MFAEADTAQSCCLAAARPPMRACRRLSACMGKSGRDSRHISGNSCELMRLRTCLISDQTKPHKGSCGAARHSISAGAVTRLPKVNVASNPPAGSAAAAGDVGAPEGAAGPPSTGSGAQPPPPLPAAASGMARARVRGVRSRYVDPLNAGGGSAGAAAPRAGFAPPPGALIDCLHMQVRYYNKDAIALLVKTTSIFFKIRVLFLLLL